MRALSKERREIQSEWGFATGTNLKQIGIGTSVFANENDGCLPRICGTGGGGPYMYN
jgi:hypothetical protein